MMDKIKKMVEEVLLKSEFYSVGQKSRNKLEEALFDVLSGRVEELDLKSKEFDLKLSEIEERARLLDREAFSMMEISLFKDFTDKMSNFNSSISDIIGWQNTVIKIFGNNIDKKALVSDIRDCLNNWKEMVHQNQIDLEKSGQDGNYISGMPKFENDEGFMQEYAVEFADDIPDMEFIRKTLMDYDLKSWMKFIAIDRSGKVFGCEAIPVVIDGVLTINPDSRWMEEICQDNRLRYSKILVFKKTPEIRLESVSALCRF
jgi:hypothetical protein